MLVWAAYLLPSRRIGAAIRDAARRAEAEIMLGERSDVPVSRWASERLFTRFLRAGLRIHCYRPQIVHAKALVLDDVVYVGSSNLDVRSLLINYELLLRIPSAALAARLRAEFESDRRHADTLDLLRWRRGRRWWQSLRSYLAYQLLARLDPYLAARVTHSPRGLHLAPRSVWSRIDSGQDHLLGPIVASVRLMILRRRHHVLRSRLQSTDSKIRTSIATSSMRTANAHDRAQRRAAHAYCRPAGSLQRQTCQEAGT